MKLEEVLPLFRQGKTIYIPVVEDPSLNWQNEINLDCMHLANKYLFDLDDLVSENWEVKED